jgi:hypothetical protein
MAGLAVALGGGGARGDFEVGALHFLYERGMFPELLCTTSVGSVNGLKLAEGHHSDPEPVSSPTEHIDVFWRGTDGALWHKRFAGGWNTPDESLGGATLGSDPHAVAFEAPAVEAGPHPFEGPGLQPVAAPAWHIEVFWRGTDGALWHKRFDGSTGGWLPHESLGAGPLGSDPCPVAAGDGCVEVFWRGLDGRLWHKRFDGTTWLADEPLGAGSLGSDPRPIASGAGHVDVFWRGPDGVGFWHQRFDHTTGSWLAQESLGAGVRPPHPGGGHGPGGAGGEAMGMGMAVPTASDPSPVVSADGQLHVFSRGSDGALWCKRFDGSTWLDYESLGAAPLGSDPYPITSKGGRIDVFWRGRNGELWHKRFDGSIWLPHASLGAAAPGSDPHPVVFGDGHIEVFWRGTDSALWHKLYNRSTDFWFGSESLGPPPTGPRGLAGLTGIWLSLNSHGDFFAEEPWLTVDHPAVRWLRQFLLDMLLANAPAAEQEFAVNGLLRELRRHELGAMQARLDGLIPAEFPELKASLDQLSADWEAQDLFGLVGDASRAAAAGLHFIAYIVNTDLLKFVPPGASIFNLGPLAARGGPGVDLASINAWAAMGHRLRIAMVGLESGELRYVTTEGALLSRNLAPLTVERGTPPACQPLDAEVKRLQQSGNTLAEQVLEKADVKTNLQNRRDQQDELKKAREKLDKCLADNPPDRDPITTSLFTAALASSTMPVFFTPVRIGGESYVDAGLRSVIPVEAAVRLGAERIVAVAASRTDVDPSPAAGASIFLIALRSLMDIAINEVAYRDVHAPGGFGASVVTTIQPRVDIHTTLALYPAFIRNRMAYGYMCAADLLDPPANPDWARWLADRISILRYGIARLECWRVDRPVPPTMVTLPMGDPSKIDATLTAMRAEVASLVGERINMGAAVPFGRGEWDDPKRWSTGPEVHPWNRVIPPVEPVIVPDVHESNLADADTDLAAVGLRADHTGDFTASDAWVYSQSPIAGATVPSGSTVTLNFRTGPKP